MAGLLGPALGAAGTIISAQGQQQAGAAAAAAGVAQQQAADYSATVLQNQAVAKQAQGIQAANIQTINTGYVLSSARANAAAAGAASTSPSVVSQEGQIAARGEYNALSELYMGNEAAAGMNNQAALDIFTGQQEAIAGQEKQKAANLASVGTMISGIGSLAAKYGGAIGGASSGTSPLAAAFDPEAGGVAAAGGLT